MKRRTAANVAASMALGLASPALAQIPPPNEPAGNPTTEAKRILGKVLFWDEQVSSDNTVACATCHRPEAGGGDPRVGHHPGPDGIPGTPDDRFGSPGVRLTTPAGDYAADPVFGFEPQVTGRVSPSAVMSGYYPEMFWDGRAGRVFLDPVSGQPHLDDWAALESQAVGPPLSVVEMSHAGRDWEAIVRKLERARPLAYAADLPPDLEAALAGVSEYAPLFEAAFGSPSIKATGIAKAIAAYERTLIADQTPWDRYNAGDLGALSPDEVRGLRAFEGFMCDYCHTPPMFMDELFLNVGVSASSDDPGRQAVTGSPFDRGSFKTPSLRNVGLRPRLMHNGRFASVREVVDFYAQSPGAPVRIRENLHPVIEMMPIDPAEVPFVAAFLQTGLTDPRAAAGVFPFDHPTLFSERADGSIHAYTGTGVPGTSGHRPGIIADSPPMLGNPEFRVGIHGALAGAQARLEHASLPPTGDRISAQGDFGTFTLAGSGSAGGHLTLHLPLTQGAFWPGQVLYVQWAVEDPGAPGGASASQVVRLTLFCPRGGCEPPCDPDVNQDGNVDQDDVAYLVSVIAGGPNPSGRDPDFNGDGNVDQDDTLAMVEVVAGGPCP
jgi:cytochrome c peroxidase